MGQHDLRWRGSQACRSRTRTRRGQSCGPVRSGVPRPALAMLDEATARALACKALAAAVAPSRQLKTPPGDNDVCSKMPLRRPPKGPLCPTIRGSLAGAVHQSILFSHVAAIVRTCQRPPPDDGTYQCWNNGEHWGHFCQTAIGTAEADSCRSLCASGPEPKVKR